MPFFYVFRLQTIAEKPKDNQAVGLFLNRSQPKSYANSVRIRII